ncbi:MAG: DUF3810 domain-containing protein [Oscillospiraceae bacterium]|jgi:hypothetical protein|nr:DUF3810 domain-containing protein [Oscillospiraceae bacterium]
MIKPIRRLISAGVFLAVTGLLLLAATQWKSFFFSFYPQVSRWCLGVLAGITALVPFAVWEIALVGLVLWFFVSLVRAIMKKRLVRWITGTLVCACAAVFFFVAVWGLNYLAPSMTRRMDLQAQQYTPAQLREATAYYLSMANETAPDVARGADGVMLPGDFSALAEAAGEGYARLAQDYDCFSGSTVRVKKLLSSKLLGKTGTTGVFIAFTGESGVNTGTFTASLPFTMCHEIGHRMAFAREDEANFAAFLACEASPRADFRYSGYYSAFIYCYNALYRVDPDAATQLWAQASPAVIADCTAAVTHNREMEDEKVSKVTDKIYDSYLKAFSVDTGRQSYGEVVDLLAIWYFQSIK